VGKWADLAWQRRGGSFGEEWVVLPVVAFDFLVVALVVAAVAGEGGGKLAIWATIGHPPRMS